MLFMKLAKSRAMAEAKNAAEKAHQTTESAQGNRRASWRTCSARLLQQNGETLRAVTSQPPMVTDSEWFGMSAEEQ